jgi:esterase
MVRNVGPDTAAARPSDRVAQVNGLRLHYREAGAPDALPLLLLHGITGHAGMWDNLMRTLAGEVRCIALDFRGYGRSDRSPDGAYERSDHAADVAAFVEALDLHRVAVLGFSLGGAVAMLYAATQPERLAKLVVVESGAELPPGQRTPRPDLAPLPASFASLDDALAWARRLDLYRRASDSFLRAYLADGLSAQDDGRLTWRFDPRIRLRLASPQRTPATPLWYVLPAITAPTLLVRGEESRNLGLRMAQRVLAAIPDCRLVQVPGAGHGVPWDAPEVFAAVVRRFLLGEDTH